jgi:delta24(24(1))-sterol reductase
MLMVILNLQFFFSPFTSCHSVIYITNQPPSKYHFSTWSYVALYLTYTAAYYVFDTSNSQKARFKMENDSKSQITSRIYGFPQLSYGTLKNPKVLVVGNGDRKLLIDGWWAVCRHPVSLFILQSPWNQVRRLRSYLCLLFQ